MLFFIFCQPKYAALFPIGLRRGNRRQNTKESEIKTKEFEIGKVKKRKD